MPDPVDGGSTPKDGKLVASDGSDNSPSALEVEEGSGGESIDFGLFTGETETPAKTVTTKKMPQKEVTTTTNIEEEEDEQPDKISSKQAIKKNTPEGVQPDKTSTSTTEEQEETEEEPKQSAADKLIADKRDYSKFDPKDIDYLKKLPNAIFKHLAPIAQKRFEVETQLKKVTEERDNFLSKNPQFRVPENWYEHDEAYTLTPEWKQTTTLFNKASQEASFWEEQLLRIENKQKFQQLNVDKNGNIFGEGEFDPTPENKLAVMKAYQQAQGYLNRAEAQAQGIINNFKTHQNGASKYYETNSDSRFNGLREDLRPKEEHTKAFLEGFVLPQHRNTPLAKLAAKMFSVIINQGKLLSAGVQKATTEKRNINDKKLAGAPSKPKSSPSGVPSKELASKGEIDLEDLETEMTGGF